MIIEMWIFLYGYAIGTATGYLITKYISAYKAEKEKEES